PVAGELAPVLPAPPWPLAPGPVLARRDDFDLGALEPCWISVRDRPERHCTTTELAGWLTLRARGGMDDPDVVFVGRRQQHLSCRARALIDPAEGRGGLAVRLDERHHYEIEAVDGEVTVLARIGPLRTVVASQPVPAGPVVLGVQVTVTPIPHDRHVGPDTVAFGVEASDGTFTELGALDGRYLSTEVAGGFTGRVIGMYAAAGTVHFDWFDYELLDR
ncbi:MAG TPA: glycoside hydrolase family 43 protein, partial [Pseudonocardiaceae bacterium]